MRALRGAAAALLLGLCHGIGWAAGTPDPVGAVGALAEAAPPPGRYDATLCVAVGDKPAECGPVVVDMGDNGLALVSVADMRYRLEPMRGQLGVSLFQGNMQLDGFFANHRWSGSVLKFSDPDKPTRYELQLGKRRMAPP